MFVTYFRSSSYNNFDYCQMQYFLTYVLGYRSVSGKKAQLGTIVHKVFEIAAGMKKMLQDNPDRKRMTFIDPEVAELKFTRTNLDPDHPKAMDFLYKLLDISFEYYTSRDDHEYKPADYKFCKKQVDDCVAWNDGQFDVRRRNVVAPEPHFDIVIDEPWAKYEYELPDGRKLEGQLAIKGTIDLVTLCDDEETIEIIDWKTGRRVNWATGEEKTYEYLQKDPQLLLYNYAMRKLFPQYKQSILSIFYIRDGGPFSMCYDESDEQKFLDMLRARFEEVKNNLRPMPISPERKSFKCTRLCDFYKKNWPGTDKPMCNHVEDYMKEHGHDKTVKDLTSEGFDLNYYQAPGSTE